jgi:arylsulfatase A-like enzyme
MVAGTRTPNELGSNRGRRGAAAGSRHSRPPRVKTMKRARLLVVLIPLIALAVVVGRWFGGPCPLPPSAVSPRPSIVLIIIDTLRSDKLGAYGYPVSTSAELDSFGRRGVRFARVVAQSSWTRPSVASLLTSRYPRETGIYKEKGHILDDRFHTLAELLKQSGYTTVGATANPNINSSFNFDQGFEHYEDSDVVFHWMQKEPGKASITERPIRTAREVLESALDWTAENGPAPYYVQVNLMEVHQYDDPRIRRPEYAGLFPGERHRDYLQAVYAVSKEVDRFIRSLEGRPEWDNALFVVTSDHGEGLSDHPHVALSHSHGLLLYSSQVLVPLIFYTPSGDLPRGKVIEQPVRLLDLMPTLLDYAGVPAPEGAQGVSLLPLIRGEEVSLPGRFVVETQFQSADKIGVYGREWEYIENRDGHRGTSPSGLHRVGVKEDGVKTSLARRHPEVARDLAAHLERWEAEHPKAEPTLRTLELPPSQREQLRALGYAE